MGGNRVFIGAINTDTRSLIQSLIPEFDGLPIYVGCSGNFTVERLLASKGLSNITGNDVSLYTTAIGNYLVERPMKIGIKKSEFNWLEEYMKDAESKIATLLICSEYFKYIESPLPYYQRQEAAYRNQFSRLHGKTLSRVKERLANVRLKEYVCDDVLNYVKAVPENAVFLSFPPTYNGGYEKLYRKISEVFEWEEPRYTVFTDESYRSLSAEAKTKRKWVLARDKPITEDEEYLIAEFQPASTSRTVCVYSNIRKQIRVTKPNKSFAPVLIERATGELKGDLKLIRLKVEQLNTLRSEYMTRSIQFPAIADVVIGICDEKKLLGVLGFKKITAYYRQLADAYMVADFCVGPSVHKRLSKLVLCVALSKEVREILEAEFQYPIRKLFTTVFTHKAVSMKYRGLFEVWNRKEDGQAVNYVAETARWSLKEAYEYWKNRYGDC